jgi:hypothetical protein
VHSATSRVPHIDAGAGVDLGWDSYQKPLLRASTASSLPAVGTAARPSSMRLAIYNQAKATSKKKCAHFKTKAEKAYQTKTPEKL